MEKNTLENMTFKDKEQTLQAIFNEYQLAKFHLDRDYYPYVPSHRMVIKENQSGYGFASDQKMLNHLARQNSYREYVNFIDNALLRLIPLQRTIIVNEYIHNKDQHWWEMYYSKATYYRYKKEAMDHLLLLLLS